MVYYTANIAGTSVLVNDGDARNALALFGRYPADGSPIDLGQRGNLLEDCEDNFFTSNSQNLSRAIKSRIYDVISEGQSIALFPLAPQPLLMYLGWLLNDKYNVAVFQCHRREQDKWRWYDSTEKVAFQLEKPADGATASKIALVFSLSSKVVDSRIKATIGNDTLIYSVTIESPNRAFVTNPGIMDDFVTKSREALEVIKQRHGKDVQVNVFPAMPTSLAVRFGMDYMSKTDNELVIFDEQPEKGFVYALTIGGKNE
jgi:hypothetical protein